MVRSMEMADRIKQRRRELKMSQKVLSELAGISQPAIVKIEKGAETAHVVMLAKALQVTPDWLQFGDDRPYRLESNVTYIGEGKDRKATLELMMHMPKPTPEMQLAARYTSLPADTKALIDIALSDPDEPIPHGLSPSIRTMINMVREAIKREQKDASTGNPSSS